MGHGFHSYVNVYRGCIYIYIYDYIWLYIYIYSMIHWRTYCGRVCFHKKKSTDDVPFPSTIYGEVVLIAPKSMDDENPSQQTHGNCPKNWGSLWESERGFGIPSFFVDHKWIILKLENCNQSDSHPRWGFEHAWHGGATNEIWWPER